MTDEQIDALMNAAITGDEEPRDAYRAIFRAGIRAGMLEAARIVGKEARLIEPEDETELAYEEGVNEAVKAIRQAAGEP